MAHIDVRLLDNGDEVLGELGDGGHDLFRLLPGPHAIDYPYLRFIDPYDDTSFSGAQMAAVIPELRRLAVEKPSAALDRVIQLAERCEAGSHLRLVFIGD